MHYSPTHDPPYNEDNEERPGDGGDEPHDRAYDTRPEVFDDGHVILYK